MNHFLVLLLRNLHAPCASQAHACVLCAKLLLCCCPRTWPARDPGAMQRQTNTFLTLHIALFTPHTAHFTLALHLNSSPLSSSHLNPCLPICQPSSSWQFSCQLLHSTDVYYKSLHKALPSTTVYYKACTKHFPVLLCTTKLAQTTSQYYFVLQSLHKLLPSTDVYYKSLEKLLPSTTLYYKACTNYFPILLCTTKLAQTTSQYYFVLQSLHKLSQTTSQYWCLLQKLAQNTSQYYFVLQSLHKLLPSTTLYYRACTNYFPVLTSTTKAWKNYFPVVLCTTRLAQTTSQYYFVLQSFHKALPSTF